MREIFISAAADILKEMADDCNATSKDRLLASIIKIACDLSIKKTDFREQPFMIMLEEVERIIAAPLTKHYALDLIEIISYFRSTWPDPVLEYKDTTHRLITLEKQVISNL